MKKAVLLLLVFSLILSLCACQSTTNKDTEKESEVTEETTDKTEEDNSETPKTDTDHSDDWYWMNGVYFNSFIGMTFKTFDNWTQYTNEELEQLRDSDYANLNPVVKNIYKDRIIYAAYSNSEDKDSSFSVGYENKTKLEEIRESKVSLDEFVSDYKNSMTSMFKNAEVKDIGDISFCNNTYRCLEVDIHSSITDGVSIRKNIYFRLIDDYFITITLTAGPYGEESIDDIVARCAGMLQ